MRRVGLPVVIALAAACHESNAPPISRAVALSGNRQVGAAAELLAQPLRVQFLREDNSVARDVEIEWVADTGAGAIDTVPPLPAAAKTSITTRTSADGEASVWWRLASGAHEQSVTARLKGTSSVSVTFSARALGVLVMRFDGARWTPSLVDTSGTTRPGLVAIWGESPSKLMAVGPECDGRRSVILRYDGTSWKARVFGLNVAALKFQEMDVGPCPDIAQGAVPRALTGRSIADVYMLVHLRYSSTLSEDVWRWDGNTWLRSYGYVFGGQARYGLANGIWLGPTNAYVVFGRDGGPYPAGMVDGFDGSVWTTRFADSSQDFKAIWGATESDITAVGAAGSILHFDGSTWVPQASGTSASLLAIDGLASSDIVAVGDGGTILRYNGIRWTPEASGTTDTLRAVRMVTPSLAFAVGDNGVVVRYDGSRWTTTVPNASIHFRGIWAAGPNDVYAVGIPK